MICENLAYLPVPVAGCWARACSDGLQSDTSKSMTTASELSGSESLMDACPTPLSLAISEHSLVRDVRSYIEALRMSSPVDSLVSPFRLPENNSEPMTHETCGPQQSSVSASYDPGTHSWRTCQGWLLLDILEPFFQTWSKAGLIVDGEFYPQPKWERRTKEIAYGLWPTPRASLGMSAQLTEYGASQAAMRRGNLEDKVLEYYPLEAIGTYINPQFVEKMMGFPEEWTDLKPLAMDKFQQWQQQHGICSEASNGRN